MGVVRLYAVGIDELRDLFSGSPETAARLRALAADAFAPSPTPPERRTLLGKIGGPLMKRPVGAPVRRPGEPTASDLEALLAGHYLPPERLDAGWALVRLWLEDAAWGTFTKELDEASIDELDFALCGGGVEAQFSLRKLFNDRLALPLAAAAGSVSGYVRAGHALGMAEAYRAASGWLDPARGELVGELAAWLGQFDGWAAAAVAAGRPAPDLVALFHQ